MPILHVVVWTLVVGATVANADVASGQDYPNKPIRIVTGEPGSANDFVVRLVAPGLSGSLGQPVIVDNRGALLSIEIVSRASSDGYTLLVAGSTFWIGPLLKKTSYDPVRDFAPITLATTSPAVLVVHPSVPVKSVKELIAYAKTKPGELNYGSGPAGSANHLAMELFKSMAGVNIVRIPYKGTGPAGNALIGGEVQLMLGNAAAAMPHLKSGRLRALAVGSAQPSALLPGLPTVAASVPGYESAAIQALFAPAGTPAAIISRLNREVVLVLNAADTRARLFDIGVEVVGASPGQAAAKIKSEMARLGKVIKDAGIRGE